MYPIHVQLLPSVPVIMGHVNIGRLYSITQNVSYKYPWSYTVLWYHGLIKVLPTRPSCRGYTTQDEKGEKRGGCSNPEIVRIIVHKSQSTRRIRVCAGTTHCCAAQKFFLSSSTQKRIFVHPHPRWSIPPRGFSREGLKRKEEMEILYERCAGLDVHKKNVKTCLKTPGSDARPSKEVRTYATKMHNILEMRDWLKEQGCTI